MLEKWNKNPQKNGTNVHRQGKIKKQNVVRLPQNAEISLSQSNSKLSNINKGYKKHSLEA